MIKPWKTYYCTDHDLFEPTGCASVVSAIDKKSARKKLRKVLKEHGLNEKKEFTLTRLKVGETIILYDGNY